MNEAELKAKLMAHIRQNLSGSLAFRHEDKLSAGIPDISVTYRASTIWIEGKMLRDGSITDTGLQRQNMKRLERYGKAIYVIWSSNQTFIVQPCELEHFLETGDAMGFAPGHDHALILDWIRRTHGRQATS